MVAITLAALDEHRVDHIRLPMHSDTLEPGAVVERSPLPLDSNARQDEVLMLPTLRAVTSEGGAVDAPEPHVSVGRSALVDRQDLDATLRAHGSALLAAAFVRDDSQVFVLHGGLLLHSEYTVPGAKSRKQKGWREQCNSRHPLMPMSPCDCRPRRGVARLTLFHQALAIDRASPPAKRRAAPRFVGDTYLSSIRPCLLTGFGILPFSVTVATHQTPPFTKTACLPSAVS